MLRLFLPLLLIFTLTIPGLAQQRRRGGPDRAPAVGTAVPKVKAEKNDGSGAVDLGKPKRHTVLVFGSYT